MPSGRAERIGYPVVVKAGGRRRQGDARRSNEPADLPRRWPRRAARR